MERRYKETDSAWIREELERFFSTRVYLDLHVRVREQWREDEQPDPARVCA